ncbi:MAG: 2-amino-4-hydroxy-6-hydroxymethyldihydropteridine diphosphokinase [Muribaculaceae bacterium]|nr:2-amino-4-hydroxy-6-hydroxymethyldihydropteridine diphosphokinase [Muribaculaceae bacterium]
MILSEKTEVILCIGSNCGDRVDNVSAGLEWLSGILRDFRHSPIYATPDCHGGMREYMNAVASGRTDKTPSELERICKDYETACGRDSAARALGDVPVDIDIVVYGGAILRKRDYGSEFFQKGFLSLSASLAVQHPHCTS